MGNRRDHSSQRLPNLFASTRYYGSKRKQIGWLSERLLELSPTHVLDPMGGTGTVAHALSVLGIPVTYSDALDFNVLAAGGLFHTKSVKASAVAHVIDRVRPKVGTISRRFRSLFFTDSENNWLDGLMQQFSALDCDSMKGLIFYALVQACLKKRPYNLFHRANLYMRTANVQRAFGNAVTWERSFQDLINASVREAMYVRSSLVAPVFVASARDVLRHDGDFDLVYLDPPYFRSDRTSDSYMRRYHFLEGLAKYSTWDDLVDPSSPIFEFKGHCAPTEWSSGDAVLKGIGDVAESYPHARLAVSYVDAQQPSVSQLERLLRRHRRRVKRTSMQTNTALSSYGRREVLLVASD